MQPVLNLFAGQQTQKNSNTNIKYCYVSAILLGRKVAKPIFRPFRAISFFGGGVPGIETPDSARRFAGFSASNQALERLASRQEKLKRLGALLFVEVRPPT